ncbi:IS30 family transposase, partial [Cryptosporangium japonicum]|uniref:IS30 family transposase n=1 Tax=Cryptosporangium japonicum TaxID=80872 RepID=UPI003CD05BEC
MPKLFPVGTRERFLELVVSGQPLDAAAAAVGAGDSTASDWWKASAGLPVAAGRAGGGLADRLPAAAWAPRLGTGRLLSFTDRKSIETGLRAAWSLRDIAADLGRSASTISREVARGRGPDGIYYAAVAHAGAHARRRRPKPFTLARSPGLCQAITEWMDQGWSPALIARVLREQGDTCRVSHETIYRALYVQTRGHLRADLHQQLSLGRSRRTPRTASRPDSSPFTDAFTISQRPADADDRAVPGHWEGDLILGTACKSAIGTLVERTTRYTILLHLPERHDAHSVAAAMITAMSDLPEHLRRSITWDRGAELADYAHIQLALNTPVFFCDPRSPWQRGTNENTNRLLRHWFTKGTDLSIHTAEDLHRVAASLNARPRPTLDMKTPAQALNELL